MASRDRLIPLCEILLGAAYADHELHDDERAGVDAMLVELAGERTAEVDACIASFDPHTFDVEASVAAFERDAEEDKRKVVLLASRIVEADGVIDLAENEYLSTLASLLKLPQEALDGVVFDVAIEEAQETFAAVRRAHSLPPPLPPHDE